MKSKFINKFKMLYKKKRDKRTESILLMIEYKNYTRSALRALKY